MFDGGDYSSLELGFSHPHRLCCEQSALERPAVILPELQRGAPADTFEPPTIKLSQRRAMPTIVRSTLNSGAGEQWAGHDFHCAPDCL